MASRIERKTLEETLFIADVINSLLTLNGKETRLSKKHEFCTAQPIHRRAASLAVESLKRARVRSIRIVGTEVSTSRGRG